MRDKESLLKAKNIAILREEIAKLPKLECEIEFGDWIKISSNIDENLKTKILNLAKQLKPWRKGPFELFGIKIESEWNSYIKFNLLMPYVNLKDKEIADVGCNNGYYMFKMLPFFPKSIIGFDPMAIFYTQFEFLNHFINSNIKYELLGIQDLDKNYKESFDVIFCLGVIYHRSDPIGALKNLFNALRKNGELVIDSIVINGESELCLCPKDSYAKMSNVYFLPTVNTLKNWLYWCGFKEIELLEVKKTTLIEQRKTEWIDGESLDSFVDFNIDKTIEGYEAPKRAYLKAKKDG